jgi:hypothetical protein
VKYVLRMFFCNLSDVITPAFQWLRVRLPAFAI